ncbi:hypothetical protein CBS101457_003705 [Exobasidium rhododendri]|nr:hypothetical protein CBS101457_003705 [Exobasidium rhododendri]
MSAANSASKEEYHNHNGSDQQESADGADYTTGASLQPTLTSHGHVLQTSQPAFPLDRIHRKLALPIPLAAFSIAATIWLLGLLLLRAQHTTLPNAWLINGLPMGFFATTLSGVGEIFTGNTFGCALFLSVGGLIFALALPFLPWSSVGSSFGAAYGGNAVLTAEEINVATGIFLLVAWAILFCLLIASQRTAIAFVTSLVGINLALITFGVGLMTGSASCVTTAGALFIITSVNLFYNGTVLLLLETGHPLGPLLPFGNLAPKPVNKGAA